MVLSRSSPEIILLLNIYFFRPQKGSYRPNRGSFRRCNCYKENNDYLCFCQVIYVRKSFINKYLLTICQVSLSYHIRPILRDFKLLGVVNDTFANRWL